MLGMRKKKRTGTQIAQEIGYSIAIKVKDIGKHDLSLKIICVACIALFSFSICFGIYGLVSRLSDITKKEQNVEKLEHELVDLGKQLEESLELKHKLITDSLAIEALARSHGMSKKGEKIFFFLD